VVFSAEATDAAELRAAVEAQFLAAMSTGARRVETAAFSVHLWPEPDPFYRNVAVPTRRPADWTPAIAAMRHAFSTVDRLPRLEFIEERWPDLAAALSEAGFVAASRMPVMIALDRSSAARPVECSSDWQVIHLDGSSASGILERYLEAANAAFGQPLAPAARRREALLLASELAAGRCRIGIIVNGTGDLVAGAGLIGIARLPIENSEPVPIAELAGVWTSAAHRGRGLASLVTTALLDRFGASHGVAWLGAKGERSAALYSRLGFRAIGHQRIFSDRALDAALHTPQP
jgi:RimJ/RimL family protein N-acetyltransferase